MSTPSINVSFAASEVHSSHFSFVVTPPPINMSFVNKLDRTNLIWREQMISVIIAYGLESYIDHTIPSPSQFVLGSTQINLVFISCNSMNS